jgi:non-lysosomal glucosylceramidase
MSAIATIQNDLYHARYYLELSQRAKKIFIDKLWNGRYLHYDSSTSAHHNSIMADMMAGQWYCHICQLPPILTPKMAMSCFEVIYKYNVCEFGEGKFIGAVNGKT